MAKKEGATSEGSVKAAFGAENRSRLIDAYFADRESEEINAAEAWKHVYRLLLWADQTTGLGHCYESDKSQPGKNWYARSLAFHDWVSTSFNVKPAELATEIDWLFLRAAKDLAAEVIRKAERINAAAARQRLPFAGRDFPEPGEDPELVFIVRDALGAHLVGEPTTEQWRSLVQRLRQYLALENKRKNLVGEGFEDVLAQVICRTCCIKPENVSTRRLLHELPGFAGARGTDKPNRVDLAVIRPSVRTLVTAKWSVRADREKQFSAEFGEYVKAESDGKPFDYVFVTNEFDPARLMRACEKLASNSHMFTHVVHISTEALRATYGPSPHEDSMRKVLDYVETGRLISLERWLVQLAG